jgi:hypothetical protein
MKKVVFLFLVASFITAGMLVAAYPEDIKKEDCFFFSSLHYTTRGMGYWYDKANGGLETLTGIPYASPELGCIDCHVKSCDVCHKTVEGEKSFYSAKASRNEEICLNCHKREKTIMNIDKAAGHDDVHFAKKMQCMDCHTARDVHGDGTEYDSMKQPGAIDAKCENCHASQPKTTSHQVHGDKLECKACHVRHVVSCANCHIETLIKERKRVDIKLSGWIFLLNYDGKVTSANTQTFVVKDNKTFLMFAPQNSHSIMKQGRVCSDCHATETVKQVRAGKLEFIWLENGELKNVKGVIPVAEGAEYKSAFLNFSDGKWVPIENPASPMIHYAGYGSPLSKDQLRKMSMPMGRK